MGPLSTLFAKISGDKTLWALVAFIAAYSFLPVYSSSSNLAYVANTGSTTTHLFKHAAMLAIGFGIMFAVHRVPLNYFKGLSFLGMPIIILLLAVTLTQGSTIDGANASRWIKIPGIGLSFQTSTLALVVTMVYVARYLSKLRDTKISFASSLVPLWLPVVTVVGLIFPANLSTALMIFMLVMLLLFVGGYPLKYLVVMTAIGAAAGALFIILAMNFPDMFPNRVDTWVSRIESFSSDEITEADYQVQRAKTAIATGGIFGLGAGKSVMKNFLPQSSSDFIFAIIVEEYGMVFAGFLVLLYLLVLLRIVLISYNAPTAFAKLLVIGLGLPIVFQAFINMGVAVALLPVTGQTLPLISSGGTSIWMTCLALGMILSASRKDQPSPAEQDSDHPLNVLSEEV
ncbi:MAG TPA: cell division protein FtsW [Flavobacteriaceae bacterium]|jgi:cell division protein FtsW|nr:cell division protein FtsW [Flavobacteriaceae bacterium]